MPYIHLTTFIAAPRERVFDLSRSVDVHRFSMKKHQEQIINGRISGLLEKDDSVTWTARHLFKKRVMKTHVTQIKIPEYFIDEQVNGDFSMMKHEHYFKVIENGTLMIDQFHFETPYGSFGTMVNRIYLEKYMTRLLEKRNAVIKEVAEGNQWKQFLNP
jgi:ligand-binding SRPBCC domain-containing protein